jgi:mitochondrial distribution and morphology protein 10
MSSQDMLVGFRGLWNFGSDPRLSDLSDQLLPTATADVDDALSPPINGRLSAGLEVYYGLLNKGGGRTTC